MVYRFGRFEVDDRELRLSQDGMPVQVEPKVLRLLVYLVENRNRLVRKQELLDTVWQDAMVTENALTRSIGLLRKALNERTHNPRYIETVPTAGYRFIANVTVVDESSPAQSSTEAPSTTKRPDHRAGAWLPNRWLIISVALIAILIAGIFVYRRHNRKIFTEKDTIVLADFDNSTGDPVFDATLRRGMAVQLEQSPFLDLVPDDRIQQVLREMSQPADARLTPAIAREICERTGSSAVLDGSIAPLGTQYVLGLRAKDCSSGKVLAEQQVQAARKEDVLNALDQMADKFRTEVGESLATVEKYNTPLAEATTSSLEALKAYSLGMNKLSAGANTESLPFFSRAVDLDPNFAAAYLGMSGAYANQREPELSAESVRKAYALREKVGDRERLGIEATYFQHGAGELDKAVSSMELYQQIYPRAAAAHNTLGILYRRLGNYEKGVEEFREAIRLNPNAPVFYQNLAADLVSLNRLDEAEVVYKLSDERHLPYAGRAKSLYLLAFLKGDQARMAQLAASVAGKRNEDAMLGAQADTEAWYGRLKSARRFTQRAMDLALHNDAKETAAGYQVVAALFESQSGDWAQSRTDANAAITLGTNRDVRTIAALTLAQSGDAKLAEKLAAELDRDFPLDTLVQRYWLPTIRAAIALQHKDANRAIELLEPARPVELAGVTNISSLCLLPAYVRGEAYLMLHDGYHAAAEFQKFIDHRGNVRNAPVGMLARLGLARAYAMQGDITKARAAYQDFLAAWKDADPEIPILQQAKAELAKLS